MNLESNLSKQVPSPILVHLFDPGVEEAFFTLARDIKKRLIDTAGKDDGKNAGNVNVNQKQNAAQGSCCNFDLFQVVNSFVEVINLLYMLSSDSHHRDPTKYRKHGQQEFILELVVRIPLRFPKSCHLALHRPGTTIQVTISTHSYLT
jgi:hypothetical protein